MKTAKKIMSVILTVMLVLSCVPMSVISVSAADNGVTIDLSTLTQDILFGDNHSYSLDGGVTYIPYEGAVTFTGKTEYSVVLSEDVNTSHDIILDNVTMTNQNKNGCILIGLGDTLNLTVKGTNTLTQTGGFFSNSAPAIYLNALSTLNITEESTGVLNTTGGNAFPAIGGRVYFSEININGGTINAFAGSSAAAIGYSYNSYMSSPSYINIENAVVNATSYNSGAAIGGGEWTSECGTCYITFKNSVVNVRSNEAGIGSGYEDYSIYNIKIEDSYVKAVGGEYGSGIGAGNGNKNAVVGDIEIINSVVYAIGGDKAAGIGGSGETSAGNIKITKSTVTAIGGVMASGIGTGAEAVVLESDKITIDGSNIKSKLYDKMPIINSDGENVRLLTIILENAPATSVVTSVPGVKGYEDVNIQTLDSILYMYVPEGSNPNKVIANGKEYVGTVVDGSGTFVYEHDCDFEENGSCEKCGTIYQKAVDSDGDGYVEIGNENQLNWFSRQVNSGDSSLNAILTDDIVVNEGTITAESANVTEWSPIGCYNSPYEGAFNGNNKTISGLYFNDECADNIGVFGYTESDCSVKNLTLSNSYFCGNKKVGGIVGYNSESAVDNCINNSEICGSEKVGGIVGYNYYSNVSNCTNNGKIIASKKVGGIVGHDSAGAVENCLNAGEILGIDYLGGIIGHELFGTVTACGNEGEITGLYTNSSSAVNYGGLAGAIKDATIFDCYNKGNISSFSETYYKGQIGGIAGTGEHVNIKNCYNIGELFSTDLSEAGGIFGYCSDSEITNCYNTAAIKGTVEFSGGIVGGSYGNTIVNCYNSGACTGTVSTGGIIASSYSPSTVSNCYYLENCAVDSEGNSKFGIGDSTSDESEAYCAKTKKQFVSGEVTYLLNNGVTDGTQTWYQTLGTDDYPVFEGETVYCIDGEIYANSETIDEHTHNYFDGTCTICGKACEHKFTDGICNICDYECPHGYLHGICMDCGKKCEHDEYEDSICKTCGEKCTHNFVDDKCVDCGKVLVYHNFVDGTCTDCGEELAILHGTGLTIHDDIGVKLTFRLSEVVLVDENAFLEISVPSGTKKGNAYVENYKTERIYVKDAQEYFDRNAQETVYIFTCYVTAKDFASTITSQLHLSDGTVSKSFEYQVKQYADQVLGVEEPMSESVQNFVKALMNYGTYAQYYFDYNTENPANGSEYFTEEDRKPSVLSSNERTSFINDNALALNKGTEDKVKYYGSSLLLENTNTIRHYFTLADSSVDVSTLNVTVEGEKAEVKQKGNLYYVDIEDITPTCLGDKYTVKIDSMTIEYSCLSYASSVLNAYTDESGACTNAGKQNLVNLVSSLYDYSVAADNLVL